MADKSVPQVAATLIVVCLVVHTAICVPPDQVGSSSSEGDEFRKSIDEMLGAMDTATDPCDDFYKYACGNWPKRHPIPDWESHTTTVTEIRSNLNEKLKGLLEKDISPDDGAAIIKAKTLYRSCMDESAIDRIGPEPLLRLINNELGGWPLLGTQSLQVDNAGSSASSGGTAWRTLNWIQLMGRLRTFGDEIIIGQTVDTKRYDSSQHIINLYPAFLGMPSTDYYEHGAEQFKAYTNYMNSTVRLLNANNANLESDITDILLFETRLAIELKTHDRQYNSKMKSIKGLQLSTPAIKWHIYLAFAFQFSDIKLSQNEDIDLYGFGSIKAISDLIARTPEKTVINYLLWRFVMNRMDTLGSPFAELKHEFEAKIYGLKTQAPRHKYCVDFVNDNMGEAVSLLYIKSLPDGRAIEQAKTMVDNIKVASVGTLKNVPWMDEKTRVQAEKKVDALLQNIGFPHWFEDPTWVTEQYKNLHLSAGNFFENAIQAQKLNARKNRSKLKLWGLRDDWTVLASTARVKYSLSRNLINLSAGIMQPPLFHPQYLKSMNYGGLGTIIGSEISEGFTYKGHNYSPKGKRLVWWSKETFNRFADQTKCMVSQYNAYFDTIGEILVGVDGEAALDEHISNYAGVKAAFSAYVQHEQESGIKETPPELELTNHKVFFIKFAQNWCQNLLPHSIAAAYRHLPSPVGKFRVMGTLSNLDEFADTFRCPVGTPMNPSSKCKVW